MIERFPDKRVPLRESALDPGMTPSDQGAHPWRISTSLPFPRRSRGSPNLIRARWQPS
ncbi:hypothetical protein LX86_002281 [Lentzea aerocolonigenes]|nr:hypothetical protein [Lentzea aerocolonigenes]